MLEKWRSLRHAAFDRAKNMRVRTVARASPLSAALSKSFQKLASRFSVTISDRENLRRRDKANHTKSATAAIGAPVAYQSARERDTLAAVG